uniref:Mesothelin n=1 Tax=Coturnix japonica TaxID=93934 RepID=A0A8C2Y7D5_COTJA
MEPEKAQELAKVMKRKNVKLGADQLSCLVKMVTLRGIPKDLDSYPKDLLLFLSPSDYAATGSCKQYFANVGKANLDLLQRESSERQQLLLEALTCLKIPGTQVNKENAKILGRLVCDLGEEYIRSSAGTLLKELSQCESFLPDQEEAIRSVISSGNTTFGTPQVWSASTLNELTGLIPVLDHSIWQKVPKNVLTLWLKNFARDSRLSRAQLATIVEELLPSRQKRDVAGCPDDLRITEEVLNDDLMPIYYTPEELRACLKNVSLKNDFPHILTYPFSNEQLAVLKEKLDETYPDGYPDSLLPRLGLLASLITAEDISKWKITSADMLAALLELDLQDEQAASVISRYVALGNPLNATALDAINKKYLCVLNETLLNMIDPNSLKLASLDPSACSQLTKNILYVKAKRAFSDQHYLRSYYTLIEPYLGGAPGVDIKSLSKDNVNMNVDTLVNLRRDALMSLTPTEVKDLLGINLPGLSNWRNRSPIQEWAQRQKQTELDKLGVGLTGGTQEGYMNVVPPKFQPPSSAPLGTVAMMLHLLPALLLSFLMMSIWS